MNILHLFWIVPVAFVVGGWTGILIIGLCVAAGKENHGKADEMRVRHKAMRERVREVLER